MERNSDKAEALRAIEAAKSKIWAQDYTSARTLIRDAVEKFPGLEHASEMQAVCNVLCSSSTELPGCGRNWYWVMQLFPSVESKALEAQYQKLVALLEPIMYDFPGTTLALELVHEAFFVLSDPAKRAAFDSKMNHVGNSAKDSNDKIQCAGDLNMVNGAKLGKHVAGSCPGSPSSSSRPKRPGNEFCSGIGYTTAPSVEACTEEKQRNKKVCAQEASLVGDQFTSRGRTELQTLPRKQVQDVSCALVAGFADTARRSSQGIYCSSDEASFSNLSNPIPIKTDDGIVVHDSRMESRKPKWSPKDFIQGQVWAVYDDTDAMPRLYVRVNKVISPARVSITFLEPHPMIGEEIQWLEEKLPIVCGIFRAGRGAADLEMSMFSHFVKCDRSTKGSFYRIFPQKGEVWAIYRNWNISWKAADLSSHRCRVVVEIISEFSEETGSSSICSLIEVPGRLTFFQRQLHKGFELTRRLPRLEMLSFSHRIPAFKVLEIKDGDIPEGSWHLEPNALPPKFNQAF